MTAGELRGPPAVTPLPRCGAPQAAGPWRGGHTGDPGRAGTQMPALDNADFSDVWYALAVNVAPEYVIFDMPVW